MAKKIVKKTSTAKDASQEFEFKPSGRKAVRLAFRDYNGKKFLDCREWYLDEETEQFKPGKGFTVKMERAKEFLDALSEWAATATVPGMDKPEPSKKAPKEEPKATKPVKKAGRPAAQGKAKEPETWDD